MSSNDSINVDAYDWQKAFRAADKPTLSSGAFGVLLLLSVYADKRTGANAFPSVITLAKQSGADRKTVGKALSEAERLGWIKHANTLRNRVKSWQMTLPTGPDSTATEDQGGRPGRGIDTQPSRGIDTLGRGTDTQHGRGTDTLGRGTGTQRVGELAPITLSVTSAPTSPVPTSPVPIAPEAEDTYEGRTCPKYEDWLREQEQQGVPTWKAAAAWPGRDVSQPDPALDPGWDDYLGRLDLPTANDDWQTDQLERARKEQERRDQERDYIG